MDNLIQQGQDGLQGFGQDTAKNLDELNKALGTGSEGEAYGDFNDMSALRPQSLEGTLKVVTAKKEHIKFWKTIGKKKAYNTVEEFNVLDSYGGDSSPFFTEGGLPNEEDSNYLRQSQMVKFLGTTRVVTHPATLVRNTVGDIVARETQNGTLWLLQQIERALYFGDSSLDPLAFDGIIKQVTDFVKGKPYENQHVIDMRGEVLDQDMLEDLGTIIDDNYGNPNLQMHLTNQVHKDFSKLVRANQRTGYGDGLSLGNPVRDYISNTGKIDFINNKFMKPNGSPKQSSQKGSPAQPVLNSTTAVADSTTKMDAGTYYYFISSKNSAGESTPVISSSVAVTDSQAVELNIDRVTSDPVARSYRVYRGLSSDASKAQFAFEVKDDPAQATQVITDRNFDIPGTETAVLMDNDEDEVLSFKQLAPLMKLPLARISASERFMVLLYGMMQVYNPRRCVVVKNIGKLGINSNRELFNPSYSANSYGTIKPTEG